VAYLLIAIAVAATALGTRGQRPVNAAMLGGGAFAAAFFGLRGVGHPWLAGGLAVIAGVLGVLFGAIAEAWGTAALVAAVFAAATGSGVAALKRTWLPVAAVAGSIGLFVGITRQRKLEVVLPPAFAALFVALGAAIGWGPHWRGAALYQLNDVDWVLGLAGVLMAPLMALAIYRERWKTARLEGRTREMDDEELKKQIADRREEYERAAQEAEGPPDPKDESGQGT
jgi:hypothetical protein